MSRTILFLLAMAYAQFSLADLRTFQCRFTDTKGRTVVSILNIDGDDIQKKSFMALLTFKIDDFSFPSISAKVRDLVLHDGKIESAKARHNDDQSRAYMGLTDGTQATVQFDLTDSLTGGKILPATCGEL